MIRKIDKLGRISIPKDIRETLKLDAGTELLIKLDTKKRHIVIQNRSPSCIICGDTIHFFEKGKMMICKSCLNELNKKIPHDC